MYQGGLTRGYSIEEKEHLLQPPGFPNRGASQVPSPSMNFAAPEKGNQIGCQQMGDVRSHLTMWHTR